MFLCLGIKFSRVPNGLHLYVSRNPQLKPRRIDSPQFHIDAVLQASLDQSPISYSDDVLTVSEAIQCGHSEDRSISRSTISKLANKSHSNGTVPPSAQATEFKCVFVSLTAMRYDTIK